MSGKGGASRHQDLLAHMLGAIRLARSYVEDLTKDAFLADTKTQQAVILNIVIIGEAATQLVAEYPEFATRRQLIAGHADDQQRIRLACVEITQRGVVLGPTLRRAEIDAEVDKLRIRVPTASANRRL